MSYFDKVESIYPSFTKSEKKIADYVNKNGEKVVFMSMKDLSDEIKVGEATVVRFYKKIGYGGFQDLKLDLVKEDFNEKYDKTDNFVEEIAANYRSIIDSTTSLLEMNKIKVFVEKIQKAKDIYIYGIGASGIAAKESEASFFRAGLNVKAIIDAHFSAMNSSILTDKSFIIAYSLSGATKDIYDSLKIAHDNGAFIVVITNYPKSPVGELANLVFTTTKKESLLEGGSLGAKMSQLLITDVLTTAYSMADKEGSIDIKKRQAQAIISKSKD
ncbi:MAG: MurR/RpiR family transcriptional regulator [Tissierellia bacterium]|nr:MurR/RpiR family transcriptional regulator [Tissierellia bacterium]